MPSSPPVSPHGDDHPSHKGIAYWEEFYGRIADNIVRSLSPRTVYDAGCGSGFLVQALWDRGVEAEGRDTSEQVLARARPEVRRHCRTGEPTDPIGGRYDLVICVDVLDHVDEADAAVVLDHLVGASDRVLFSAGSGDAEPTGHVDKPHTHWLRQFAARGFRPVLSHDATYLSPQALLFERADGPVEEEALTAAAELVRSRVRLEETLARLSRAERAAGREAEVRLLELSAELEALQVEADAVRDELAAINASKTMRYSREVRRVYGLVRRYYLGAAGRLSAGRVPGDDTYSLWIRRFDTMNDVRRQFLANRLVELEYRPLVSVIMPVYDTPEPFLRAALDSVLAQIYAEWELCVVDDCSTAAWVPKVLDEYAARDPRVRVQRREENGHISAASNTALQMARGEWVALLDHDDVLTEHALALAVLALKDRPDAGLLYSDEDKLDEDGRRARPFFKPDFDPLLLLSQNYVCHMTMARLDLVREVGGFREGLEGAQDWDLVLRVSEHLRRDEVVHVPHVLYHWREHPGSTATAVSNKPYAVQAQHRAVREHLERQGKSAHIIANGADGLIRVRWPLPAKAPKVSIVIPTRDGRYLARCLDSIFSGTGYPDFEVVVMDNGSVSSATLSTLRNHEPWIKVVRDDRPFNYSALNNAAVRHCAGDVVVLMNDDCEVLEYSWLEEMVGQLCQEGVGAVGAKLLYPDGKVQHAGVVLGVGGVAGHAHRMSDRHSVGHFGWLFTPRTLSAVTGACMAVRRDVYQELGGLDEVNLAVSLNDVDFCLRLGEAGWRTVWTPFAVLTHHESVSRGIDRLVRPEGHGRERAYMKRRWEAALRNDPAFNPNFTLEENGEQFVLAFPPRRLWWS